MMAVIKKSQVLIHTLTVFFSALLLMMAVSAQANWNDDWDTRTKVGINTAQITEAVNQVVIPVRLHSGNFDFTSANADGSDIRVIAADDKTELKFFLESFDSVNELAVLWVEIAQLSSANKEAGFWIYSGNAEATSTSNASIFSDKTLQLRLAFQDKNLLADSSAQALTVSGNASAEKAGLIGSSVRLDKTPLVINSKTAIDANQGMTVSMWVKPSVLPQTATLFNYAQLSLKLEADSLTLAIANQQIKAGQLAPAIWHHIAFSMVNGQAKLYLNGKEIGNGPISAASLSGDIQLGNNFSGELDSVEVFNVAKSASWIGLVNSSYGVDGKLFTFTGEDEEEGGESYFGILFNSLTLDAEIVIAILAVMFLISAWVMYVKATVIVKTDKENAQFLQRFQSADSHNLLNLDQGIDLPNSTLLGLYKAGIVEIRKREKAGQKLVLGAAAMSAIKASVDAELVRKNQKLNSMMVLLTIAISGGPFLGLLGTVVGVMITFAAIAAAGDVNVNAIAPGIAAALLATVAGLAVAIPALFGYNYLASRIKNITISMQIFVDEFLTRAAEILSNE